MMYETVTIGPGHVTEIRNNALAAIRIAALAGAAKILLLGFDPERYEAIHAHTGFYGLVQGLEQIIAELRGKGVTVVGDPKVESYGITTMLHLPGGCEVMLYEPRHPIAAGMNTPAKRRAAKTTAKRKAGAKKKSPKKGASPRRGRRAAKAGRRR